jgi:hypothetical protein
MRGVFLLLPLIAPLLPSAAAEPPTGAAPDTQAVISYPAPAAAALPARMVDGRIEAAAVALKDGRVLAFGGRRKSGEALASAEVYDRASNSWSAAAPMMHARYNQIALLLPDGRVFAAGGRDAAQGDSLDSVEIYDPRANSWSEAAPMGRALDSVSAVGGSWPPEATPPSADGGSTRPSRKSTTREPTPGAGRDA